MKIVKWFFGLLLGITITFAVVERLAAERIEVVELHTTDESGAAQTTRLWVIDDEGYQYLRVGADGSGWFSRLRANGEFDVTRDGETNRYSFVTREDKSARINQLMQTKYTWGDTFFATVLGSRDGSIPIELHQIDGGDR